jgi:hypothetical protein
LCPEQKHEKRSKKKGKQTKNKKTMIFVTTRLPVLKLSTGGLWKASGPQQHQAPNGQAMLLLHVAAQRGSQALRVNVGVTELHSQKQLLLGHGHGMHDMSGTTLHLLSVAKDCSHHICHRVSLHVNDVGFASISQ